MSVELADYLINDFVLRVCTLLSMPTTHLDCGDDGRHHVADNVQCLGRCKNLVIEAEEVILVASVHHVQGGVECGRLRQALHNIYSSTTTNKQTISELHHRRGKKTLTADRWLFSVLHTKRVRVQQFVSFQVWSIIIRFLVYMWIQCVQNTKKEDGEDYEFSLDDRLVDSLLQNNNCTQHNICSSI